MRSRNVFIVTVMLALVALATITAIVSASAQPAVVQPADEAPTAPLVGNTDAATPEPDKLPVGSGAPGVYAARDWRAIDPGVFPVIGGHDTFTWAELEPTEGVPNWTRLDKFIADQTAVGKKIAFGITTYNGRIEGGLVTPSWLQTNYPATIITQSNTAVCTTDVSIPRYWDATYLAKYSAFVQKLANHVRGNANITYAQIGVGLYGETQASDDIDDPCVKAAMNTDFGFTTDDQRSAKWIETVNKISDNWGTAFTGAQQLFLVYTPTFINICEKRDETLHAAQTNGIGLFAGGFDGDTLTVFSNPPGGAGCQKWDPIAYWNGVTTKTIPIALESYRYMLPDLQTFYWGMLGALNKHADYVSLETDLLYSGGSPSNPIYENFDTIRFANAYLGKTAATAPNAWVAMRETSPGHNGEGCNRSFFYPQYGDYDYWLYRDDTVAGGKTVTATSTMTYVVNAASVGCPPVGTVITDPFYDAKLDGKGPQGWMTRRTDHATNNDYMYFRLDNSFKTGQTITSAVVISVTYLDYGSDDWQLKYYGTDGGEKTLAVAKTNSGQWKKATFTIQDMNFTSVYSNGNNFRIYNGGSGDEFIHMVMLGKFRPAGPTPTPTRTLTPTATATATPITAIFQQGISPSGSYAGASDTYIDHYSDPSANHGSEGTIKLRNGDLRDGLIKFTMPGVPGYATVLSATLSVYVDSQSNPNQLPVTLYKVRRHWVDTQATWISATTSTVWTLAGAHDTATDIFATAFATTTLTGVNYWQDFDVTSVAQDWISNPGADEGVLLRAGLSGSVEYALRSSDYNTPADYRPILTIVYKVPGGNTPTATATLPPTATPTRTLTPTPSPVTVVFQQGSSPDVSYAGVLDTFINSEAPDANYGISPSISLRDSDDKAALLRFDVSSIPPGVNVLSAKLSVQTYDQSNSNSLAVRAYRMLRPWAETEATWYQSTEGNQWTQSGANGLGSDRDDVVQATAIMTDTGVWNDFDITELAHMWIQNPGQNMGVILKTTAGAPVQYSVWSSDYPFATDVRPKLTIVYSTVFNGPTPTTTPTRTATPSPTPTQTATPTPRTVVFQRGVSPSQSFAGVYDTFISNFSDTTTNYGISPTLELRANDVRAGLLRFDVSSMPAVANIISASISVHVDYKTNDFAIPVTMYRVARPWEEFQATWLNATSGVLWGAPGANSGSDRSTTASSSQTMTSADTWYDFDATTLVRQWVLNPGSNQGVVLKAGTGPNVAYGLRSSEYFAAPSYRPKLTITCYGCQPSGFRIILPVIMSGFTLP